MCAAVARGHGGDAGGDPPPNPNRIPTVCEATSQQKKKRGMSRSQNLDIAFKANRYKPLPIQFDLTEGTYKPIGTYANMFTRYIGNMIGHGASPHHKSWNAVSPEFKTSLLRRLREFFNLDPTVPEWPKILTGIERECQDLYRDRKSKLKKHFDRVGGNDDVANARRNRPRHLEHEKWDKAVDLFCDPKYKNRSEKNARNRSHAKYPSLHGSTSYVAARYKKKNPETQELQGSIDNWHDMHYRPNDGWANDLARIDHEAMLAEKEVQKQQHGSTSSSINEREIITKVLGECRGHNRGIGRKLKGSAFSSFFEPPPPPSQPPTITIDVIKSVVDVITANTQYSHILYNALSSSQPGTQLPPPPTIDIQALFGSFMTGQPPPQPPPQQPPQQEDDGDEDEDPETDSYDD